MTNIFFQNFTAHGSLQFLVTGHRFKYSIEFATIQKKCKCLHKKNYRLPLPIYRSDCILHPHKTKLLCQCHTGSSKNKKTSSSSHRNSHRTRSPDVFAIVSSSSSSNHEGFSSNSSNGSFGTSPIPMLPQSNVVTSANNTSSTVQQFSQVPERNMRAQSVTQVRNITKNKCLLQKSASELNVKQLGQQENGPWLRIVPSYQVRPRNCDEVPEEFKRAGIGLCFGGKQKLSTCTSPYFRNALCIYRAKNGFGICRW